MQKFYKSGYIGLPLWAKGVIAVVVVGGISFLGYKLYRKLEDGTIIDTENKVLKEVDKEIKDKVKKGGEQAVLSKPMSVYASTANSIATKLEGCDTTQNEVDVVKLVIDVVKKPIDWLQLQKSFGKRKIDNCGVLTGETEYELAELLKDQLDGKLPMPNVIKADNFLYNPQQQGIKTGYEVLKSYLNKIGVSI